jgi:hypothetical protein
MSEITNTDRLANWRNILNTMLEIEEAREVLLAWREAYAKEKEIRTRIGTVQIVDSMLRFDGSPLTLVQQEFCKQYIRQLEAQLSSADSKEVKDE